ncbi:MAG: tetratricopeptide repeat protein [Candidatus Omnitrophota bacterium]
MGFLLDKNSTISAYLMNQERKNIFFLPIISIIILGAICYAGSLNGKFILDDELLVKENALIANRAGPGTFLSTNIMAGAGMVSAFYRPLQMITYALDHAIWDLNPFGYHITNIFIHILTALCIYWLINILYNDNKLSFLTAALFVVHPMHTEAVSYISGRADPLSALSMLLCAIIYIKQVKLGRAGVSGCALLILTYVLALLSKEMSVVLPLLLLLYHFVFKKKVRWPAFVSLLSVLAVYLLVRFTYLRDISFPTNIGIDTMLNRIPGFFAAILNYIKLLFVPIPLHMEYGARLFRFADPIVVSGMVVVFNILVFAYTKRNNKVVLFSIGWFFLALLPSANLYKVNAYMAEHFLYLPSIGFFLLAAYVLTNIYNNKRYKIIGLALMVTAILFYSVLTIKQNEYWRDPITFYTRTIEFAPPSANIYYGRGIIYDKKGDYDKAISDYTMAIKIKPDYTDAYNNRGIVHSKMGNYEQAISDYAMAIKIDPDYIPAQKNLIKARKDSGRIAEGHSR